MDISTGLSAASTALSIVKDLREIDRSIDEAAFKLKIADLSGVLADTKIALSEARVALADRDAEIHELRRQIEALKSGELCPICQSGQLKTSAVTPHPSMGEVGLQEKTLNCTNSECSHQEKRMHDPMGILDKG